MSVRIGCQSITSGMGFIKEYAAAIGLMVALVGMPEPASAQQTRSTPLEDLLSSIGLAKPAMSSAPDFNLLDTHGNPVALSGYRGSWLLLNFWATWCGSCREEMPSMERLNRRFGGQALGVLAVNQRESAALVDRFMRAHGLSFTAPLDTTGRVAGYYRVYGIPASYVIDPDGQAVGMRAGPMDWSSNAVVAVFRRLLGGGIVASITPQPAKPLPAALRAQRDGVSIRRQQDASSESVGQVDRGAEMVPLGKVSGAGEFWYLVKTRNGEIGWVRGGDVEEVGSRR